MNILNFKRGGLFKVQGDTYFALFKKTDKHRHSFIRYLKYPDKFIVLECADQGQILKLKIFYDGQIGLLDIHKKSLNFNGIFRVLK